MKILFPTLVIFAFLGCAPAAKEVGLFKWELPDQVKKVELSDCPVLVKKIIYKELSDYMVGNKYPGDALIYRADTDLNGQDEYIGLFRGSDGVMQFLVVEGAGIVTKDFWFEMNKCELKIVSLVKKGECEILIKRAGGGANFESAYITLHKKQGNVFREVFAGDYFRHAWRIDERDQYEAQYYSAGGNEPPLEIRQYAGELTEDYMKLPKYCPDFETQKSGPKLQKVFAWDQAKFKFVEKK